MVDYFRGHRSLIALWFIERTSAVGEAARAADKSWAEQFWRYLVERELLHPDTPPLVVLLAFEAGNRLLDVAFRQSPTGDEAVIDEPRRMSTAYLETYALGTATRSPRGK